MVAYQRKLGKMVSPPFIISDLAEVPRSVQHPALAAQDLQI